MSKQGDDSKKPPKQYIPIIKELIRQPTHSASPTHDPKQPQPASGSPSLAEGKPQKGDDSNKKNVQYRVTPEDIAAATKHDRAIFTELERQHNDSLARDPNHSSELSPSGEGKPKKISGSDKNHKQYDIPITKGPVGQPTNNASPTHEPKQPASEAPSFAKGKPQKGDNPDKKNELYRATKGILAAIKHDETNLKTLKQLLAYNAYNHEASARDSKQPAPESPGKGKPGDGKGSGGKGI